MLQQDYFQQIKRALHRVVEKAALTSKSIWLKPCPRDKKIMTMESVKMVLKISATSTTGRHLIPSFYSTIFRTFCRKRVLLWINKNLLSTLIRLIERSPSLHTNLDKKKKKFNFLKRSVFEDSIMVTISIILSSTQTLLLSVMLETSKYVSSQTSSIE